METFEYTILEHLLCYFINGDVDNLSANELETLLEFEQKLLSDDTFMTVEKIEGTENFGKCDILKVSGDTVSVNFNIHKQ